MIGALHLLDPHARDPQLRAFAYVQACFVKGARSAIDCLQPFILYAVGQCAGDQFDANRIASYILEKYRIHIPLYVLQDTVPILLKMGALKKHDISAVITCEPTPDQLASKTDQFDLSLDEISAAETHLSDFASSRSIMQPLSADSWSDALINFFQAESEPAPQKTGVVDGVIISDQTYFDNRIISEFILECSRANATTYSVIEKIYYGVLISDFLNKLERSGNKADYKGLQVIYDTTVLMRLLGTSGANFRTATLEMHQTLQDLGCSTFYFSHNFAETISNLDYLINAANTDQPIFSETKDALLRGELSIADLTVLMTSLDAALGRLGITEHPETYESRKKDQYQIDEIGFVEALKRTGRFQTNRSTAEYDAKSLALILRLREGKSYRDVWRTKAIFVTHNALLVREANRFLREQGYQPDRAIGAVLTVGQITTVAWLANEIVYEPHRISKELIANCYKASLPMDGWDAAFWDALKKVDPSLAQSASHDMLYVHSTREIALSASRGHPRLLQKVDMKSALEEAKSRADEIEATAVRSGREEGRASAQQDIARQLEVTADTIAEVLTFVILLAVSAICAVFLFFSFFFNEPTPSWSVRLGAFVVGLLSVLDLFKVLPMNLRKWIKPWILSGVRSFQGLLGLRRTLSE